MFKKNKKSQMLCKLFVDEIVYLCVVWTQKSKDEKMCNIRPCLHFWKASSFETHSSCLMKSSSLCKYVH